MLTAAKLLAEIGPVDRFKTDAQLARHSGVAPLEASSGRTQRHPVPTKRQLRVVVNAQFDFKGNLLTSSRTFTVDHTNSIDWSNPPAVALQPRTFTAANAYDALGRVIQAATPDGSVTTPEYSEANLLKAVSVSIRGGAAQPFIKKVEHDAKGQRTHVEHGNGVVTAITYDDLTFRVRRIASTRTSDGEILQDLNYTYDPVGNITLIRDLAHQPLYFNNAIVLPDNDFTYDAVYRLLAATGREHSGLNVPVSQFDERRTNLPHKADGDAMQRYRRGATSREL